MLWIVVGLLIVFVFLFVVEAMQMIHEAKMERRLRSALWGQATQNGWKKNKRSKQAVVRNQYRKHQR